MDARGGAFTREGQVSKNTMTTTATQGRKGSGRYQDRRPAPRTVVHPDLERLRLYEQVLQAMSARDQALLVPHFIYGYTVPELAAVRRRSVQTTKGQLRAALRRVRAKLEAMECD